MAHTHKLIDGVRVDLTAEEIAELNAKDEVENKRIAEMANEPKQSQYAKQRRNSYPSIGDQLDMLWHSIDNDAELKSKYFDFHQAILAVKAKHPK